MIRVEKQQIAAIQIRRIIEGNRFFRDTSLASSKGFDRVPMVSSADAIEKIDLAESSRSGLITGAFHRFLSLGKCIMLWFTGVRLGQKNPEIIAIVRVTPSPAPTSVAKTSDRVYTGSFRFAEHGCISQANSPWQLLASSPSEQPKVTRFATSQIEQRDSIW